MFKFVCLNNSSQRWLNLFGTNAEFGPISILSLYNCIFAYIGSQQIKNHFWNNWHVSYWVIIGTAPPVRVFMCIHVNTCVLPVVTSFERIWHEFTGLELHGTVSLVRVIMWKTRDFTLNTCQHTRVFTESGEFTYGNMWIEPVELVNSVTEHVKSQVIVCWVNMISKHSQVYLCFTNIAFWDPNKVPICASRKHSSACVTAPCTWNEQ